MRNTGGTERMVRLLNESFDIMNGRYRQDEIHENWEEKKKVYSFQIIVYLYTI